MYGQTKYYLTLKGTIVDSVIYGKMIEVFYQNTKKLFPNIDVKLTFKENKKENKKETKRTKYSLIF